MIPDSLTARQRGSHPKWAAAFAAGCGGKIHMGRYRVRRNQPIALFGSPFYWPAIHEAQRLGVDWYYGDHGYFSRWRYFRCTRNAFQLTNVVGSSQPARFLDLNIPILPWRKTGKHVLFCPPDSKFGKLHGLDAAKWQTEQLAAIKSVTDRPVVTRHRNTRGRFAAALGDVWAVVTHSSNAAVEAVLNGVPVICLAPCAASAMGGSSLWQLEAPPTPDNRLEWASMLANNQWSYAEMRKGDLWRAIGVNHER